MQGAQDGSRTVPFDDQVVAGKLAAILDQAVDAVAGASMIITYGARYARDWLSA